MTPPLSFLRLIPPSVHLLKGEVAQLFAAASGLSFEVTKARAEARRGAAQRILRIHLEKARQIDKCEQQVAEFFFHAIIPGAIAAAGPAARTASATSAGLIAVAIS